MSGETVYIIECQPIDAGGTTKQIRFSAGLYNEAELNSTGVAYPVRLNQAYTHETSIFEENVPGQTNISLGSASINNMDGRFDFLLDYAWDSRPVTVKRGKQGAAYGTYVTEFIGSSTELTADTNVLTLTLRDNSYKLAKPIQTNKYAGTGGAEGGADLQNKTKPLLFGKGLNLSPVWIDQVLLTWQIHDGAVTSIDKVYDRANQLTFYQNYASYALMIAANIPPGYYATCTALGYGRLGAPPAGTLVVDAVGAFGATANIPALASSLLTSRLGLAGGELDSAAFTQASTDAPWAFQGIYYQEPDVQYDELFEILASAVNGFWYVTRTGLISFKIFKFGTSVATIRAEDIMSLGKAPSPKPLYRVLVNYSKNSTVQPPSDFTIPKQTINAYLDREYHNVDITVGSPDYSGAGRFNVFLNDVQVNDMGMATFSIPNGETWLTINSTGDITATSSGVASATAVVRTNIGEFVWDEPFTLIRDSVAPLQKIALSFSTDRFVYDNAGQSTPTSQTITITATGTNTTAPITLTAVDNLGNPVTLSGSTIPIANISPSPLVFWIAVTATDALGVKQTKRIIVQHGNDGYAEGILGSYSAAVTFFYQGTAPVSGMQTDDVWVNTADANKTYRWTGSAWSLFADTRIVDALTNAAGAQATADGKIKTYIQTTTPTGGTYAIGDLWYNPNTQNLNRWDGTVWTTTVASLGAIIGTNISTTAGGAATPSSSLLNSAITINGAGVLSGAGGGTVTLNGLGYTGLWGLIGASATINGNTLTNNATGSDGYTSATVGPYYKGAVSVSADVYAVNTKSTVLALDDDNTNFTLATQQYAVVFVYNTSTGHTVQLFNNNTSVSGPTNIGTGAVKTLWLKYTDTGILVLTDSTVRITYTTSITNGMTFYPKALLFNIGASYNNVQHQTAPVQPQLGGNVVDSGGSVVPATSVLNSAVTISSGGVLSGAGGGTVTITGIGYLGDLNATRQIQLSKLGTGILSFTGNAIKRTDASGGWTTNFISSQFHVGTAIISGLLDTVDVMLGLTDTTTISAPNASQSYFELDYAFYRSLTGPSWHIFEGGTDILNMGTALNGVTFSATTRFQIIYDGVTVRYFADGVLMRSTTTTAGRIFRASGAFNSQNASASQVEFLGAGIRPRGGLTLENNSGTVVSDPLWLNSAVSIGSNGVLSGAGGGTVTIGGLGYLGDLNASQSLHFVKMVGSNAGFTFTQSGGQVIRTDGGATWNGAAITQESFTGACAATFVFVNNDDAVNGLTDVTAISAPNQAAQAYFEVDYGIDRNSVSGGSYVIYESGSAALSLGAFGTVVNGVTLSATTVFSIVYDGTSVKYYADGVLIRTVATTQNRTFRFMVTPVAANRGATNITFGGHMGGGPFVNDGRLPDSLFLGSANLLFNGGFRLIKADGYPLGITLDSNWGVSSAFNSGAEASYIDVVGPKTTFTSVKEFDGFWVYANDVVQLEAELLASGITAGGFAMDILLYNDQSRSILRIDGTDIQAVVDGNWHKRLQAYATGNNGGTNANLWCIVRVYMVSTTISSGGVVAIRRVKVSRTSGSGYETPFTDEATDGSRQLRISGTGHRLGDGLMVPPILGAGNRYYFNVAPNYSGATTTTATVNLPAATLTIGGRTVTYSAMSVGVSGSGSAQRYHTYIDDAFYSGGSPGLNATLSTTIPYASTDRIDSGYVDVTFTAGGSGGGGAGGGGGLTCVWAEASVHTQRGWILAYDVVPGDMLWVVNADKSGGEWAECTQNLLASAECYYLFGEASQIGVTISEETPVELDNGKIVRVKDVNGDLLPFEKDDQFWKEKAYVKSVGRKNICKITCGMHCYSAGDVSGQGIFTHNWKP